MKSVVAANLEDRSHFSECYTAQGCSVSGEVRSLLFSPPGYSLWVLSAELGSGATLEWSSDHGDQAVFIRSGSAVIDSQECIAEGVFVIEAGFPAVMRVIEPASIYHFGPTQSTDRHSSIRGAPGNVGRRVHVLGAQGAYIRNDFDVPLQSRVFADSCCETCRINLFRVDGYEPYRSPSHEHSEDEIMLVLEGSIRVGRVVVGPGEALAVPGHHRYGYQGSDTYSFLKLSCGCVHHAPWTTRCGDYGIATPRRD